MEDFQNSIIRDSFGASFAAAFGASNFPQRIFFRHLLKKAFQNSLKLRHHSKTFFFVLYFDFVVSLKRTDSFERGQKIKVSGKRPLLRFFLMLRRRFRRIKKSTDLLVHHLPRHPVD